MQKLAGENLCKFNRCYFRICICFCSVIIGGVAVHLGKCSLKRVSLRIFQLLCVFYCIEIIYARCRNTFRSRNKFRTQELNTLDIFKIVYVIACCKYGYDVFFFRQIFIKADFVNSVKSVRRTRRAGCGKFAVDTQPVAAAAGDFDDTCFVFDNASE